MSQGLTIEGSNVVVFQGARRRELARPHAANDNTVVESKKTVTVRRTLEKSGVSIKIKVPVEEYVGVAVSTTISEDGLLTSAIELVHTDADLNYRVFEETGNSNIVAEWQNWGKKLRLPLFIRAGDGNLLPYSQEVDGVLLGNNVARRKIGPHSVRRARFLSGQPGGAKR